MDGMQYIYHSIELSASHFDYARPSCLALASKAEAGGETISQTTQA